jgi:hypothetical protein
MCLGGDTSGDTMDGYCTLSEKRESKNTPKNLRNSTTPSTDRPSQESVLTILGDVSLDSLSRTEIVSLSEKFWADILAQPVESRRIYRDQVVRALDQYSTDLSVETQESLDMITYYVKAMNITSPVQSNTQPNTEISEPVLEKLGTRYIDAENSLIFRSTPEFLPNNIRSYLSRNTPILVLGIEGEWSHIVYDTVDGYVRTAYLRDWKLEDDIRRGLLSPDHANKWYITVKHSLYVRSAPSIFTQIRGVVYRWQNVTILDRVGNWVEISTPTFRGYIHQGYLSVSK